jgi:hypothetical protein
MTPEEMQAMIDDLRPDMQPIIELRQTVEQRIRQIRPLTDEARQEAMDQLVSELADLSESIDVYERAQAEAFSGILKSVYDLDVSDSNPAYIDRISQRIDFLQNLRKRVSQGDRRFGIIRDSDRVYVSELFPTYATAQNALDDRNIDSDSHSVLEHMGEAWESFLALNRPFEEWQKYIDAYHRQIMSSLIPMAMRSNLPQAPASDVDEQPLKPQPQKPAPVGTQVRVLGDRPTPMLDPLTGLVTTVAPSQAPPNSRPLPDAVSTGDRDRFNRKVIVEPTLEGLDKWVQSTYRSHGDVSTTGLSDAGGVISVTIVGDIDNWRSKVATMRIPVAVSTTEDRGERSITFAYL